MTAGDRSWTRRICGRGWVPTGLVVLAALAPQGASAAGCDWPMYGHDPGHSFAQGPACARIDASNVTTLAPKWSFATDTPVSASATVVNGIAYVGEFAGTLYAIDVETGAELWSFLVDDAHANYPAKIVSSVAVDTMRVGDASIRVLVLGGGATLYVLDPLDGDLLARQDLDPRSPQVADAQEISIESSPVVAHLTDGSDRIFVGMDVHNDAGVGRTGLHAFELVADPGGPTPYRLALVYKFDPETRLVRTSLSDGSGTGRGCGGVWSSPVFDPVALGGSGLVVFGTSNCGNDDPTDTEAESEGVFAIRATTGELVWEFHPRPFNDLDDDFGSSPNLLPGGLVGEGSKDGLYYAFDRETGARAWTSHPAQSGHLNPGFAFGGIIGTPAVGEVSGEPAIFIASALSTPVGDPGPPPEIPDPTLAEDSDRMLSLHAISAVDGRVLWRSAAARPSFGAPTYANGVVFVPSTVGVALQAYDANTGVLLLEQPLPGAPASSPTIVGNTVLIGSGTTAEGIPAEGQQHGLHAFSVPADPLVPGAGILLNAQGNQLDAYDLAAAAPTTTRTTPVPPHEHAGPHDSRQSTTPYSGHDVNGQICGFPQADGSTRYAMGEDSDEAPPHSGLLQGWGLFAPTSGVAGPWGMTDKLVPVYNFTNPPNDHKPDNTGCAFSAGADPEDPADDLFFSVDLGVGAFDADPVGSLFVFYRDADGNFSRSSKFCVLDDELYTTGYLAADGEGTSDVSVLVPQSGLSSGGFVARYAAPFPPPTGPDCSYDLGARRSILIQDETSFVPISIARRTTPNGDKWVVGNVAPPLINEYNLDGTFSRPLASEHPTPGVAGVAVDAPGNVYWANLGLAPCASILCPVPGLGTLWKLSFDPVSDAPLAPVLVQGGLTYPEGVGIADPLPEPSTVLGALGGALVLAGLRRRRERRGER